MSDIITVTGNIAADPEGKKTAAGVAITTFRVASTHRRFDRASARWVDDYTNWYSVSAFRGLADHALRSLHKGDRVVLTGRLRIRDWETSTSRGTAVEITADSIGHDLLWGTTSFHRMTGAPQEGSSSATEGTADEWAVESGDTAVGQDVDTVARDWGALRVVNDSESPEAEPSERATAKELIGVVTPF